MSRYIPPPPFHTFDPITRDPSELIPAIQSSFRGSQGVFQKLVPQSSNLCVLVDGSEPSVDSATMLFLSLMDWQDGRGAPRPLDSGQSRERLGRFPSEDGNAIEYLLANTKVDEGSSNLHDLLVKLTRGFSEGNLGDAGFSHGAGGMELLGWLDSTEVIELRKEVDRGSWKVSSDEPHDGGVQDAIRHLLVFLRAAGRRKCGLLMRRHA